MANIIVGVAKYMMILLIALYAYHCFAIFAYEDGGMKKRVGLARALAMQPQIVFYDEPTAGLDPVMTMTISRLIRQTQERFGVSSLLVTHDMESVFTSADRVAMLYNGKIVQVGTVEEIKNSTNPVVRAFISGQELKKED